MKRDIDWESLWQELHSGGSISTETARKALEIIFGGRHIRALFELALTSPEHQEIAQEIFSILCPASLLEHCTMLLTSSDTDPETRRCVARFIARLDCPGLVSTVEILLRDDDPDLLQAGGSILERLHRRRIVEFESIQDLVEFAQKDAKPELRAFSARILDQEARWRKEEGRAAPAEFDSGFDRASAESPSNELLSEGWLGPIDWPSAIEEAGTGNWASPLGGRRAARNVLTKIIGDEEIRRAARHYLQLRIGFELIRQVLLLLRPVAAADLCKEVFFSREDIETRRSSLELLRFVSDDQVTAWIGQAMMDPDPGIQMGAVEVIDYLHWSGLVGFDEIHTLVQTALSHHNPSVVSSAEEILKLHRAREARA